MRHIIFIILMSFGLTAVAQSVTVNPSDYRYSMSAFVEIDASVDAGDNYVLAAMVDGECRGVGVRYSKDGYTWIYVRIYSNVTEGEDVYFSLVNKTTGTTTLLGIKGEGSAAVLPFENLKATGKPSSPSLLSGSFLQRDFNGDGKLDTGDVTTLRKLILKQSTVQLSSPDLNNDGIINIVDLALFIDELKNK